MSSETLEKPLEIISSAQMTQHEVGSPRPKKWSNAEFEAMIAHGFFQDQRVELIEGEILEMSPMFEPHALSLMLAQDECYRIFSTREFGIRSQMPFSVGEGYRPEPDLVVVRRTDLRVDAPPSSALLLIEVSDSTLRYDRTDKASLYARSGVNDYWILNVNDQVLEVHRSPRPDGTARFGFSYGALQTFGAGESVIPLAAPTATITIADLFA